jgi:hypothetical protein
MTTRAMLHMVNPPARNKLHAKDNIYQVNLIKRNNSKIGKVELLDLQNALPTNVLCQCMKFE